MLNLEAICDADPTSTNKSNMCIAQQKLNPMLENKESFGRQKANMRWIKEVDRNTKFFYHTVQQKLHLHRLKNEAGSWIQDVEGIKMRPLMLFNVN